MGTMTPALTTRSRSHVERGFEDTAPRSLADPEVSIVPQTPEDFVLFVYPTCEASERIRLFSRRIDIIYRATHLGVVSAGFLIHPALPGHLAEKAWDLPTGELLPLLLVPLKTDASTLESELASLEDSFESFPVSYNQVLACGILAYCSRVLRAMQHKNFTDEEIVEYIRGLHKQISVVHEQYEGAERADFALLDLRLIEDHFDLLQTKCSKASILPSLDELDLDTLLSE